MSIQFISRGPGGSGFEIGEDSDPRSVMEMRDRCQAWLRRVPLSAPLQQLPASARHDPLAGAVKDVASIVRRWVGEVAFRPNDVVLGQAQLTPDQLPDLYRLLDALDPDWRDYTDVAKRERRAGQ